MSEGNMPVYVSWQWIAHDHNCQMDNQWLKSIGYQNKSLKSILSKDSPLKISNSEYIFVYGFSFWTDRKWRGHSRKLSRWTSPCVQGQVWLCEKG